MKQVIIILCCALVCSVAMGQNHPPTNSATGTLVERVDTTGFIQIEAESFKQLSPKQQVLAYWLSQASIAIHPIIFDQGSHFGLKQKKILEEIVAHPNGIKPEVIEK